MAYAQYVDHYLAAGWRCVIPIPAVVEKTPPPDGYTGEHGADTVPADVIERWKATKAHHSIALRLPAGVICIDVDTYDKTKIDQQTGEIIVVHKRGDDTLREFSGRLGALPPTWASTARGSEAGPGPSRTLFYRVPQGRYATTLGDPRTAGVEILQRHHRYCVVAPSINHAAGGAAYRWYRPDASLADEGELPRPEDLPELPDAWVTALSEGAARPSAIAAPAAEGGLLLSVLMADDRAECCDITNIRLTAGEEMDTATAGSRHDTTSRRVYQLIRAGAFGHAGTGPALAQLRTRWEALTAGENRSGEFANMALSAARKAVTEVATTGVKAPCLLDPCLMMQVVPAPVPTHPAPDDTDAAVLDIPAPAAPMAWSRRALIGTEVFDPPGLVDHKLAVAALERIRPVIRYLTDTGTWTMRGAHCWELASKDLADWALTELYELAPDGDPEGSPQAQARAARKQKLGVSKSSAGVASKMRAMVQASGHPCTMRAVELDADPEILWAGALPWDLRRSVERPAMALVSQLPGDTPHLHTAGVSPSGLGIEHPTPRWDSFLAAIWPDASIRDWALHVLSVSLTGYSDAVLPVLYGESGLGKTSCIALIMSLLGTYAISADPRLLVSADNSHASIVFALKGARLAFIDEAPRQGALATSRLKQLTGGGRLTGNPMRGNPINFDPSHTLILTCNPEETPSLQDPALRRRLRLIPCEGDKNAVADARAAITPAVWRAEAPGVLAKLMHCAAQWLADRDCAAQYRAPESIRWRAEDIAEEEDPIRQWIDSEMMPCETGTKSTTLRQWFTEWYRRVEPRAPGMSATLFGRRLSTLGYPPHDRKVGGATHKYRGLRRRDNSYGPAVPPPQRPSASAVEPPPMVVTHDPAIPDTEKDIMPTTAATKLSQSVRRWIDAELVRDEIGTRTAELHGWFAGWQSGSEAPSMALFGRVLTDLGHPPLHRSDSNYRGLRRKNRGSTADFQPVGLDTPADAEIAVDELPIDAELDLDATHSEQELAQRGYEQFAECNPSDDPQPDKMISEPVQMQTMPVQMQTATEIICADANVEDQRCGYNTQPLLVANANAQLEKLGRTSDDGGYIDQSCGVAGHLPYTAFIEVNDHDHVNSSIGLKPGLGRNSHHNPPSTVLICENSDSGFDLGQPNSQPTLQDAPLTEQEQAAETNLAQLRDERNQLTKLIKKTPQAEPLHAVYTYTKDQLVIKIKSVEKRLREIRNTIKKMATIAELGGDVLALPACKTRHGAAYPVSVAHAGQIVREAMTHRADPGRLTVDIESTGYAIGHPDHAVRTVQLGNRDHGVVFDVADPVQFASCVVLLGQATELEAYSAAVEISHLAHLGMIDYRDGWTRAHDVVIKAQLHNPVGTLSSDIGLKLQAQMHLPDAVSPGAEDKRAQLFRKAGWTTDTKIKNSTADESGGWVAWDRSGWAQVDPRCRTQVDYAVSDVLDCAALGETLPMPAAAVYDRERAVQAAVGSVSYLGIALDREHIEAKIDEHTPMRNAARAALAAMGIDNPGSNDQIAAALLARGVTVGPNPGQLPIAGKSGKPSVAADVLARLSRTDALAPLLDEVLRFRKHNRLLTTYLGPYHLLCTHGDGRMRSTVYTLQADTGRMSCVHENLQNIPTHGGIRECYVSDPGDLFIDADLFGIEVAVLAALSQDQVLLDLVASGRKLHKIIAAQVYGPNYTTRQYGYVKNGVFAKLYGAGIWRIANTVGCSEAEAQDMVDALDALAPGVKSWGYAMRDRVKNGMDSITLYSGRVLRLPKDFPHKIVNYLVQGTAREILVDGILRWRYDTKWGRRGILVPVHDEQLASVPAADAPEAMRTLVDCMAGELYGVKIKAEPKWQHPSDRWLSNDHPLAKV